MYPHLPGRNENRAVAVTGTDAWGTEGALGHTGIALQPWLQFQVVSGAQAGLCPMPGGAAAMAELLPRPQGAAGVSQVNALPKS